MLIEDAPGNIYEEKKFKKSEGNIPASDVKGIANE